MGKGEIREYMLFIELYKDSETTAAYLYLPEGQEPAGRIEVDKLTGNITVASESSKDIQGIYKDHATKAVYDFFLSGTYEKKKTIAWC